MFALKCGVYSRAVFNLINTVVSNFVDSSASAPRGEAEREAPDSCPSPCGTSPHGIPFLHGRVYFSGITKITDNSQSIVPAVSPQLFPVFQIRSPLSPLLPLNSRVYAVGLNLSC